MREKRLHAIARGRVQAVGFRFFVIDEARALGLSGWVRNGDDCRTVEVVAEGPEERLRQLEAALRAGPRMARVDSVEAAWSDAAEGYRSFEIH